REALEVRQVLVAALTGEERGHEVAVVRRLLRVDDGHVAVEDSQLDQAVPSHPEGVPPGTGELAVHLQDALVRNEALHRAGRDRTGQRHPAWRPLREAPWQLTVVGARALGGVGPPERRPPTSSWTMPATGP